MDRQLTRHQGACHGYALIHRGEVLGLGGEEASWFVGFSGTGTAYIEGAFHGTFVAPNGTLRLQPAPSGGHYGAFFAKNLIAEPDVILHQDGFNWDALRPPDLTDATTWEMPPSPVLVTAVNPQDGTPSTHGLSTPPSPITFQVPTELPVDGGNAGNGVLV